MDLLHFSAARCDLCRDCIEKCPFHALRMGERGIEVSDACRMCRVCIEICSKSAISFEQKPGTVDKTMWKGILVYIEQENGGIHPIVYELIGEARRLAAKIGYDVFGVIVGPEGTAANAEKLLVYGLRKIYVYEHPEFEGFRTDCYTNAVADCIAALKPSVVLIGATSLGRSLAPRLSTRFHTGLTADCTKLEMRDNSDLVQIRPAFGGNVMAQIIITDSRPQFATVRYKVMARADRADSPAGELVRRIVTEKQLRSRIKILSENRHDRKKPIEQEDILVVAGRGVRNEKGLLMIKALADQLGGQLCYSRPMIEAGYGDTAHQIGLSGRTVKPKLIITCGVSGAIQFASCMSGAECIVAINSDPGAPIFNIAHYCIADDLYTVVPALIDHIRTRKEV
jgi:electron transfer flavoprotein alpha subunit